MMLSAFDSDQNEISGNTSNNNSQLLRNELNETIAMENMNDTEEQFDVSDFELIHPSLSCSVKEAMTMIYAYSIRHNLNWKATEDAARLVNAIIGINKIPTSKYKFKQTFIQKKDTDPTVHYLCHVCEKYLGTKENLQTNDISLCQNCQTGICFDIKYSKNHFISIPIEYRLKNVLEQNSQFLRLNSDTSSTIRDVHEADNFQRLKTKMNGSSYITLTINTDGAAIFRSTKEKSFWPVQFYVNEIDLDQRFKRQNMLCSTIASERLLTCMFF